MKTKLKYGDNGLLFIPHFIQQDSDLNYGEVVTHENYNEKLNLNRLQGDYNTEVLRILFTDSDPKKVPHVPYLDERIDTMWDDFDNRVTTNTTAIQNLENNFTDFGTLLENIIKGDQAVGMSAYAHDIAGVEQAGIKKYYGTNEDGIKGFFRVPDSIYAIDSSENEVEVTGVYFTPQADSIDKTMLTPALRSMIEQSAVTTYPDLENKPKIENVELIGNITLDQIGAQPKGEYLTVIPAEYVTDTELAEALLPKLSETDADNRYATIVSVTNLETDLTNYKTEVANTHPVIAVNTFTGTPKIGDLLITL